MNLTDGITRLTVLSLNLAADQKTIPKIYMEVSGELSLVQK